MSWKITLAHEIGETVKFNYLGVEKEGVVESINLSVSSGKGFVRYRMVTSSGEKFTLLSVYRKNEQHS